MTFIPISYIVNGIQYVVCNEKIAFIFPENNNINYNKHKTTDLVEMNLFLRISLKSNEIPSSINPPYLLPS